MAAHNSSFLLAPHEILTAREPMDDRSASFCRPRAHGHQRTRAIFSFINAR